MTINCYDNKLYRQQIVQTISCTKKGLSYNKIVKTIVSSNYCFYNSLLRPKSLSMPYSCRAYLSTAALPYKVGRDEYDRTDIGNCDTAIKKRKILRWRFFSPSAGLDLVRADWPPLYLCTIRNGIRDFACAFAYNAFGLASSVSLTVGRLLLSLSSTIVPVSSV